MYAVRIIQKHSYLRGTLFRVGIEWLGRNLNEHMVLEQSAPVK